MKRKLAIFMSFVMLFSTAVILPADKEHPAKSRRDCHGVRILDGCGRTIPNQGCKW